MRAFVRLLVIFISLLFVLATVGFFMRDFLLRKSLDEVSHRFKSKYGKDLHFGNAYFVGFDRICINDVWLLPVRQDTLLAIDSMSFRVNLIESVLKNPSLASFHLNGAQLSLVSKGGVDNYSFLLKKDTLAKSADKGMMYYADRLISRLFSAIPKDLQAERLKITYSKDDRVLAVTLPLVQLNNGNITGSLSLQEPHHISKFSLSGILDKEAKRTDISLVFDHAKGEMITLLDEQWSTLCAFDSCRFAFAFLGEENNRLVIGGQLSGKGFRIRNARISAEEVHIEKLALDYKMHIGGSEIELDSSSSASINALRCHPFIKYRKAPQGKLLTMRLHMPSTQADSLFRSLPEGLFGLSRNIEASGRLSYQALLDLNLSKPDSVVFVAEMKKENLKLDPLSLYPITRVNQSFDYSVYEKGKFIKSFPVGFENPDYYPLMKISELLKNCVLTSEDGAFFYHRGFNEEMFAKAIRDNIKKKRFARGASTITMQMVKNVFLNRNKTIARKLDEALLVWLIENNRLLSKERILEVYLNIIEWGPGVYGIGEASRFYFNKKPADLNLEESVFLASIVPNPKLFMYSFDADGNLKPHMAGFYKLISGILLKRMVITDEEYANLKPNVKLKGPARELIRKAPAMPIDSLLLELE